MDTSVIITSYKDEKINSTIESLLSQRSLPDEIIIVESSDEAFYKELLKKWDDVDTVRFVRTKADASVAHARNRALEGVKGDIVCFLDTDEVAPSHWLERITSPIIKGEADFTGGPTKNVGDYKYRDYFEKKERYFYRFVVSNNPETIPMGNSAWLMDIFDEIDGFDNRLDFSGEDWDVNIRAVKAGYGGKFVQDAWVYHNQSSLDNTIKIIKKKYKYNVGGAMAHIKNQWFEERSERESKMPLSKKFFHWLEIFDFIVKPFALVKAYRMCKKRGII